MGETLYTAIRNGNVKQFDRVLVYQLSHLLGVEWKYTEIYIDSILDNSIPNEILLKYTVKSGENAGITFWKNVSQELEECYVFEILGNTMNNMVLS